MRVRIRSVSIWSAMQVGCIVSILPSLCIGVYLGLIVFNPAWLVPDFLKSNELLLRGAVGGLMLIVFAMLGSALGGAISWGLFAIFYNIAAWVMGGLSVNLARERVVVVDDHFGTSSSSPSEQNTPQQSQFTDHETTPVDVQPDVKRKSGQAFSSINWNHLTPDEEFSLHIKNGKVRSHEHRTIPPEQEK